MFEIKVRDHLFIAHSLKDDFFGEAKNLHGATYAVSYTHLRAHETRHDHV